MNYWSYCKLPFRLKRLCCSKDIKKTNCNESVSEDNPKSVLSWNIQSLFCFTTPLKVKNIIENLLIFNSDVICLQEVFEDSIKQQIIKELIDVYPYYLMGYTNKKYILCEDSGLLILSKYNINFVKEELINECVLPDKLCGKTIIYFSIGNINFSNTHLQAHNPNIAEKQIKEIVNLSPFDDFIITGDLNHENADEILNITKNNVENTWENVILDYIIPIQCKNIKLNVIVIKMDLRNVTDHLPICSDIKRIEKK